MKKRQFYLIALAVAALDQLTKSLIAGHLSYGDSIPLLGGLLRIAPTRNYGGAFGMLQGYTSLLTIITVVVIAVIVFLSRKGMSLPGPAWIALALQLGGAVGNLTDRVRLGYVFDFIELPVWPVFNVADSAITIGIILLAIYLLIVEKPKVCEVMPEPSIKE